MALLVSILLSSFSMPLVVIFSGGIGALVLNLVDGLLLFPLVKTDLNCYISISAFSLLLLNSCPFFFSGCTPILSCLLEKPQERFTVFFF